MVSTSFGCVLAGSFVALVVLQVFLFRFALAPCFCWIFCLLLLIAVVLLSCWGLLLPEEVLTAFFFILFLLVLFWVLLLLVLFLRDTLVLWALTPLFIYIIF